MVTVLLGLRERTRLLGGDLEYGAVDGRGFRVLAHLPVLVAGGLVIRVAVVDDQELVRSGFVVLLRSAPDIEVVGEAGDGQEAWDLCRRTTPDVVLMDVRMPRMDGLEATRRIMADPECSSTRVLILTTFDEDELVHEALRAGASGFLLKDTRPTQLLEADRRWSPPVTHCSRRRITRRLIEQFASLRPAGRRHPRTTT